MSEGGAATTAADLARLSLGAVKAKDREAWLELFEDDAVVEDPVGPSSLDPTGDGRQGKAAIARFYDDVISTMTSFDFEIERSYRGGDEAAMAVTFTIGMGEGDPLVMDLINIYRRSPDGRLSSLRSFWDGSRQG
jgi:steroid Delta-isomerase